MTDYELKKLNRRELLEILLEQGREIERLQAKLKEAEEKLRDRELRISNAGSLAEASLSLNGVFEAAQAAADQYLENIRNSEDICRQMQKEAEQRAAQIVAAAEEKAAAYEENASQNVKHYWDEVSQKLEHFYSDHQGLKELLSVRELQK